MTIARQLPRILHTLQRHPLRCRPFTSATQTTPKQRAMIGDMLKVDHAGEVGANFIYQGQLAILGKDAVVGPVIQHMWDQEKRHLATFDRILAANRVSPTVLMPLWKLAGYSLGVGTALLGKEAAMACTEAVETVVGEHYNDQLRVLLAEFRDPAAQSADSDLSDLPEMPDGVRDLTQIIREFRDEELEHKDTAVAHDAHAAPAYRLLGEIIKIGCKGAIWITNKV